MKLEVRKQKSEVRGRQKKLRKVEEYSELLTHK